MLLRSYNELTKEQGYVEKLIGHYVFHPQYKNPGTITGRLAGAGGVNIQQIPKERGYMQCWRARPGCVWIHSDVTSLEQVVMAELSGDETLMRLYGPNANPNHDVYLFTGCYIKGLQSAIRRYYDPDNPTPEGKRLAKQHCAKQRAIAKKLVLSSSYGAGPRRIHQDLQLQGVSVTLDDVFSMHRSYWQLYSGVAEYGEKLNTEWTERGGWVYNGLGRPMTASPDKTKDLVNTVCQSTGHDILMILLYYTSTRLDALGIEYRWIIPDWHDEYILEIEEKHVDKTVPECEAAYADLNNELAGTIPITGDVDVVTNLWEAKTA
jgi:DNA polymerase I-like protein with 3'-5' exonuclease and polymerase domains